MPHTFANTMFSEPARELQRRHGSRAQYERMARHGAGEQKLGLGEVEFIAARDSFYIATVTPDGWPYIQHRGGPRGFLRVLDERTLAFADYSGNKQYITAGNLSGNDRFALFLMDYPNRTRLKLIGRARSALTGIVRSTSRPVTAARKFRNTFPTCSARLTARRLRRPPRDDPNQEARSSTNSRNGFRGPGNL
jgi:predicted pyridoxine 5'-phosphate oxidase superfamily flavin-nucleotide-binding protein